jgi:hypothetical protein
MKNALITGAALLAATMTATAGGFSIQGAIQAAQPGDTVMVPAGTYTGAVILKEGVFLVGQDGADATVLDGGGAPAAVYGAKDAAVVGFTIRNAIAGVRNAGQFIGVFECRIADVAQMGVALDGASSVIANNLIKGQAPATTGVEINQSNPYLVNNIIGGHQIGVHLRGKLQPNLEENRFIDNQVAILAEPEASAILLRNHFSGNGENLHGVAASGTEIEEHLTLGNELPYRGGNLASYRDLMRLTAEQQYRQHPCVVYLLNDTPGEFDVITLFPYATFSVGASAPDTTIAAHRAEDLETRAAIRSQLRVDQRPWVDVINPEIRDRGAERFACEKHFVHPASLQRNEKGQLVFHRMTTLTRIEVVTPEGWLPVSVNYPATFVRDGARWVVKIVHPMATVVDVALEPAASSTDPLGLRAK